MGCCIGKEFHSSGETLSGNIGVDYFPKEDASDISNYMCQGIDGQTIIKQPGQLNGEDFVIESCNHTDIYLLDYTAAVTIDDCIDCQIFIGPCKGSVFLRGCKHCTIMASCQQFRARDTMICTIYLHCVTQPVIEESIDLKFGCFSCYYPQLKNQLSNAKLSPFNNNWYSIHNFTPELINSWSIITYDDEYSDKLRSDDTVLISFHNKNSVIPYTEGTDNIDEDSDICLVMFQGSDIINRALQFVKEIGYSVSIIITKDIMMKGSGLIQFFADNAIAPSNLKDGEVVFLVLEGDDCIQKCSEAINANSPNNNKDNTYYSPESNQAHFDYYKLTNICNSGVSMT